MKTRYQIALICLAFGALAARAGLAQANVGFAWDYTPPAPSGFEMTLTAVAPNSAAPVVYDCGASPQNTCTVAKVPAGKWSAYCRAYNTGDPVTLKDYSDPSNTVPFTVPAMPAVPAGLRNGPASVSLELHFDSKTPPLYLGLIFTPKPIP